MFKDLFNRIITPKPESKVMVTSINCLELVKHFEGLSLKPYLCPAGIPTIGYGNTEYENGTKVTMKDHEISQERASALLQHFLEQFSGGVQRLVKVPLNQNQLDGLTAFAYNVGLGNLGSSTLLKNLNAGYYKDAAEQFLRWDKAGGQVLPGLTRRRRKEKELFEKA